jgi:hypothetical protein
MPAMILPSAALMVSDGRAYGHNVEKSPKFPQISTETELLDLCLVSATNDSALAWSL